MSAPIVVSKVPDTSATGVYLNSYITVVFDQAISQDSVNDNTILLFRVSDYQMLEKTISFSTDSKTITIRPDVTFDIETGYNVVLIGVDQSSTCIKNSGLESMAVTENWVFTTGTESGEAPAGVGGTTEPEVEHAESPVSVVPPAEETTALSIIDTYPDNYSANMGTINSDLETVRFSNAITVKFNKPVASGVAVDQSWFDISIEPVDGDPSTASHTPSGVLSNTNGDTLSWTPSTYEGNDYTWRTNNEVTVTVSDKVVDYLGNELGQQYRFMFTTPYRPYYCTIPKIRAVIGAFIRDIPDDTIARNIYFNSIEIYNIGNTIKSQYVWDAGSPTFAAQMWTCCKTQYDLLYAKLLDLAASGPGQMKRLGDFTIQETADVQAGVRGAIQKALDCSNAWMGLVLGKSKRASAKMVVKGVASPAMPPIRGVRTWTLENHGDPVGDNKRNTRIMKSPGIYSQWS